MVTITDRDADHAADMLKGMIAHPFWKGIDRDAIQSVIDGLEAREIEFEEVDDLPSWGIPGDEMVFTNRGGYDGEREHARKFFEEGQPYTISRVSIGRSSSNYYFEGISGSFNTCMFEFVDRAAVLKTWREDPTGRKRILEDAYEYQYLDGGLFGSDDDG